MVSKESAVGKKTNVARKKGSKKGLVTKVQSVRTVCREKFAS
jgi:hypothetical protein